MYNTIGNRLKKSKHFTIFRETLQNFSYTGIGYGDLISLSGWLPKLICNASTRDGWLTSKEKRKQEDDLKNEINEKNIK